MNKKSQNKYKVSLLMAGSITVIVLLGIIVYYLPVKHEQNSIAVISSQPPAVKLGALELIGNDLNPLKGAAFSNPGESASFKSDQWIESSVQYSDIIADADLAVSLDQQQYELFIDDINDFARQYNLNIAINKGTCGVTANELSKKQADVGGYCCAPGEVDRLPGLNFHTLGIAPLVLMVHPDNPITNISTDQARDIFAGNIRYWSELTANMPDSSAIAVTTRLHCKSRPGHWHLINGHESLFSAFITDVSDVPYMLQQVSHITHAIGYETLRMIHRERKPVKLLNINQLHPANSEAIARGYYPFYRVYNLTTWQGIASNPYALQLVQYLKRRVETDSQQYQLIPSSVLASNGWKFQKDELIGEPGSEVVASW